MSRKDTLFAHRIKVATVGIQHFKQSWNGVTFVDMKHIIQLTRRFKNFIPTTAQDNLLRYTGFLITGIEHIG